jgi:hypothetical protein
LRSSSEARTLNCMKHVLFVLCLLSGCGDGGEPATRVDVDAGGTGGGSVAGALGSGGAGTATGGTVGSGGATGGTIGTGGAQATGGTPGTGGKMSPSCLTPLSQVSGPASVYTAIGYIAGGGTSSEQTNCTTQSMADSRAMTSVIGGVPTGPSGWAESSYMIAPSGTYDCQATIAYTKTGSGVHPCTEMVTLKVTFTPQ